MNKLYMDESGECSFSPQSRYRHFLLTVISIDESENRQMENRLKRIFARFVRRGWDKSREVKSYELFKDKKFGPAAMKKILDALTSISSLEISYLIVNKQKILNESFRKAPYGIGYNYFSGILLSEMMFQDGLHDVHLIYDKRNKETHSNKRFREYLETKVYGTALESDIAVKLLIEAKESQNCYGLLAVDYFSWAIYRKFEHGDDLFFSLFQEKLKRRREWYI